MALKSEPEWELYEPAFCALKESWIHLVALQGQIKCYSAHWLRISADQGLPVLAPIGPFSAELFGQAVKTANKALKRSKAVSKQMKDLGIADENTFASVVPCWPWPCVPQDELFSEPYPEDIPLWHDVPERDRRLYTVGAWIEEEKRWVYQGPNAMTYEQIMAPERPKRRQAQNEWAQRRLEWHQPADPGMTPAAAHAMVQGLITEVTQLAESFALEAQKRTSEFLQKNATGRTHR